MAHETYFENGRISNFRCHVTLTLDRATWHVHHLSTSTSAYIPDFIQIGETFCERTNGRTYNGRTDRSRQALLGRLDSTSFKPFHCRHKFAMFRQNLLSSQDIHSVSEQGLMAHQHSLGH